ncbi:hypothetical protein BKA56DRAFT_112841 [Ilyonectria sp. MPI-CAGE-AT-0026]|nr:hypothetical protein BKA56DRAFT_112841 [Ilyonectria sp. MPI-CAGE-AT-0026]
MPWPVAFRGLDVAPPSLARWLSVGLIRAKWVAVFPGLELGGSGSPWAARVCVCACVCVCVPSRHSFFCFLHSASAARCFYITGVYYFSFLLTSEACREAYVGGKQNKINTPRK